MNDKVTREVVKIDEEKCTGCGDCIPACPEGALQIIDDKARLISDLYCDGLGACIGECPEDAITIVEREAEPYDERAAMENIVKKGENTIKAHLEHLIEHGEDELLREALDYLNEHDVENPLKKNKEVGNMRKPGQGCPGAQAMSFGSEGETSKNRNKGEEEKTGDVSSKLQQWPVQLHLVPPTAPYFREADVVLSADCVAYSAGDFHSRFLADKSLAIACPKLDQGQDQYIQKLVSMIDDAEINTLTVLTMEVPCCHGLLAMAKKAAQEARRNIPVKHIQVSIQGEVQKESWVNTS